MDLDNLQQYREFDPQDMYGFIQGLSGQLEKAWILGHSQSLPKLRSIKAIALAGMGGSAIGADLLAAYAEPQGRVPTVVLRDYLLPGWAEDESTLVIALSHSGNTEETLSIFEQAGQRGCARLAITAGGKLAEMAAAQDVPVWQFIHKGQPRSAVGYTFGMLLAAYTRLGILADPYPELQSAIQAMRQQQEKLGMEIPVVQNPAKRQAGQIMDRWVTVMGAGILAPVARRWKGQISEIGKAWAQFEFLPEADHNTLAGLTYPPELLSKMITIFLRAPSYHPRNLQRTELTRKIFMMEGLNTDMFTAKGDNPLAHMWTTLHFGDFMAYYLAIAYGVDPTPVPEIEQFKLMMKD